MLMIVTVTTIINSCCSLLLVVASVDMIIVISCTQGISSSKIMFPTLYFVHHFISISWLTSIICFWNGLVYRTEAEKGVIVTNRSLSVWFLILCKDNFIRSLLPTINHWLPSVIFFSLPWNFFRFKYLSQKLIIIIDFPVFWQPCILQIN